MDIENAKPAYEDTEEDKTCPICDATNSYVKYDGDIVCQKCSHAPAAENTVDFTSAAADAWQDWWDHRDENYDGFYGSERVKMVGGFESPWFGDDGFVGV